MSKLEPPRVDWRHLANNQCIIGGGGATAGPDIGGISAVQEFPTGGMGRDSLPGLLTGPGSRPAGNHVLSLETGLTG